MTGLSPSPPASSDQIKALQDQLAAKADAAALSQKANTADVPKPASNPPMSEKTGAATGAITQRFALEDHQHPRLTSTNYATLASDGTATVTFTRSFTNKPGINLTETDAAANTQPLVLRVQSWVQDANSAYTGCVIRGSRAQMLPTINPLSGALTLISGVVTGVNALVAQLTGYNVFGGSAAGAQVSCIAVARSDVAST
jgi:hypothetical protein